MTAGAGRRALRDAASRIRDARRPHARLPALGQPAAPRQDDGAALPGGARRRRSPTAESGDGRVAGARDRRRGARRAGRHRHAHADRLPGLDARGRRRPSSSRCRRTSTPSCTSSTGRDSSASERKSAGPHELVMFGGDGGRRSSSAAATGSTLRVLLSRAGRSASRSRAWALRDEHAGRDHPGVRGLPEREAGVVDPGPSTVDGSIRPSLRGMKRPVDPSRGKRLVELNGIEPSTS